MSVMLSKEAQAAVDQLWAGKRATLEMNQPLTPEAAHMARTMGDDMMAGIPIPTSITVDNIEVEETRGEFYTFDNTDADKIKDHVLLFIHGGGFATGTVASRRPMCASILAHAKMDGYSTEYAGSPELRTPELGRLGSKYEHVSRRFERSMISPVVFAGMSYRELMQM